MEKLCTIYCTMLHTVKSGKLKEMVHLKLVSELALILDSSCKKTLSITFFIKRVDKKA